MLCLSNMRDQTERSMPLRASPRTRETRRDPEKNKPVPLTCLLASARYEYSTVPEEGIFYCAIAYQGHLNLQAAFPILPGPCTIITRPAGHRDISVSTDLEALTAP